MVSATLTLATGCGGDSATGSPTTAQQAPSTASSPGSGEPYIENPLDTSSIDNTPCDVTSKEQIESLPGTIRNMMTESLGGNSQTCAWVFEGKDGYSLGSVRAGINREAGTNGLQTLYKEEAAGNLGYFEELDPIKGYPVVAYERATKNQGDCTMAVGFRNDVVYLISIGLRDDHPNYDDPCTIGRKIAEFGIEYLQGRQ
jgi:hypothetical protein